MTCLSFKFPTFDGETLDREMVRKVVALRSPAELSSAVRGGIRTVRRDACFVAFFIVMGVTITSATSPAWVLIWLSCLVIWAINLVGDCRVLVLAYEAHCLAFVGLVAEELGRLPLKIIRPSGGEATRHPLRALMTGRDETGATR